MRRFFDRPDTHWRSLTGCLHLYAIPSREDPVRRQFEDAQARITDIEGLGPQPVDYLHATIQRFDAYTSDLDDPRWMRVLQRAPALIARHQTMELILGRPEPRSHAIEAVSGPSESWDSLLSDLRVLIIENGLGHTLTPPPARPHVTLAYCTRDTADAPVAEALLDAGTFRMTVPMVSLVAVSQDPHTGVFSYDVLTEWQLADRLPSLTADRQEEGVR